jgi:methylase of polypeptide subunit release factors
MAIGLAKKNLKHNIQLGLLSNRAATEVTFRRGNVLAHSGGKVPVVKEVLRDFQRLPFDAEPHCDVLISNPPYISPESFWDGTTSRSVRIFEPKLALVPPLGVADVVLGIDKPEDLFYYHIIQLSFTIQAKLVVLECGSRSQAARVAAIGKNLCNEHRPNVSIKIWPDTGALTGDDICSEDEPCVVVLQTRLENALGT